MRQTAETGFYTMGEVSNIIGSDWRLEEYARSHPWGAWLKEQNGGIVVGATLLSPATAIMLVFALFSSGMAAGIAMLLIEARNLDPMIYVFVGVFLLVLILALVLDYFALKLLFGKLEVVIGRDCYVFSHLGPMGRKKRFSWDVVKEIRDLSRQSYGEDSMITTHYILLDGPDIEFGAVLTDKRREYMLKALKYIHANKPL